jgi:AraC-like DNA-binding protein
MDGSPARWYFSTVSRRSRPSLSPPRTVDFLRTKYGRELLLDAGYVSRYAGFEQGGRPHALAFHDILLVTRGRGRFALDGEVHAVSPGVVFFSRPGDLRQWRLRAVDGACVFFTEDFVADAFADPRFLDQFAYFRAERPSGALTLGQTARRQYLERFAVMQREIAALRDDAPHALRAVLYEILVLLNRLYAARFGAAPPPARSALLERFRSQVEHDFRRRHRLADYAGGLGVSPGHLSALCRSRLRLSAGAVIRQRIALEAKRLLLYGDLKAAQVGEHLGFEDPAYFARFFRREVGTAPSTFRARKRALLAAPWTRVPSLR